MAIVAPLKVLARRDFDFYGKTRGIGEFPASQYRQKTRGGFYTFEGIVAGCDTCKTGKSEEKEKKSKQVL